MRRVVITGVGLHTPLGDDLDTFFDGLLSDRTGSVYMPTWAELDELATLIGAPVPGFDGQSIPRKVRRTMGRVGMLSASAAELALNDAGLTGDDLSELRSGVIVGSTGGSSATEYDFFQHLVEQRSARGLKSTLFFQAMSHTCAANVALHLGIRGELFATNSACASSNQAIGLAAQRIRDGYLDAAVVGGAEELTITGAVIFASLGAATTTYNDRPDATARPFDAARDGIVVGEGAGIFVLEEREQALARGARIYAEVLGAATVCDAHHMAAPHADGMRTTIERCLRDARLEPSAVEYVNAHATGTRSGDASEADAIHATLGDAVPVSSIKGHTGHTLGACGAIETAACIGALQRGVLPGTRNCPNPDVAPVNILQGPLERRVRCVMNTNFAFGGVNAALLLGAGD